MVIFPSLLSYYPLHQFFWLLYSFYSNDLFLVTDVELKRLRDAFRRTCGLSCYMSQQCFFKEVLGDMVPLNISEVWPILYVCIICIFHMLQGSWMLPLQAGKIWPICVRACGMCLCVLQHVIIGCGGILLKVLLAQKCTLSICTVILSECSSG